MYSEINEAMERLKQGIARLQKIDAIIPQLQNERRLLMQKEEKLRAVLKKENLDVEKLEGRSLRSIFYSISGGLDERKEKERAEALAAKLKFDQAARDIGEIKRRIAALESERHNYRDFQSAYDALFQRKKEALLRSNGDIAHKILELTEKIGNAGIKIRELQEAKAAGEQVLRSLNNALDSLDHADDWGTWDLLGGGLISDLAKHSHIDAAKEEIAHTQSLLRTFRSELADVKIGQELSIEIGGFAAFADFFFDGLLADWYMKTKIHDSRESVATAKRQVTDVVNRLRDMEAAENDERRRLEAACNALVEKTQ